MTEFTFVNNVDIVDYSKEDLDTRYNKYFSEDTIGFKTSNTRYFKYLINYVASIVNTINFKFRDDGLYFTSMDSSHIALIDCFIPVNFFSCYNFGDKEIVCGVDIKILIKILTHIGKNDELVFKFKNDNYDNLEIIIINEKFEKYYTMRLMDIISDELQVSEIPNTIDLKMESKYFKTIIGEFKDIGDVIKFQFTTDNEISLSCEGEMTKLVLVLNNDDIEYSNIKEMEVDYSFEYFEKFSKGVNLGSEIEINIVDDCPIKMSYSILDNGYINYYLAPKIEY